MPLVAALLLAGVASASLARAQAPPEKPVDEARRIERIAALGRLWGSVKFLHPWLAYKEIDWDAALVRALPKAAAARDAAEYAAAASEMLGALGDPATEIVKPQTSGAAPDQRTVVIGWPREGVLHARLNKQASWSLAAEQAAGKVLAGEIDKASAVILDLREAGSVQLLFQDVGPRLVSRPLRVPARRRLLHSGYRPQEGSGPSFYTSAFVTRAAETFAPARSGSAKRVVFILSPRSPLPPVALALIASGDAAVVGDGAIDERLIVEQESVRLADGLRARVRVEEVLPLPGFAGLRADVQLAEGEDALAAALRLLDQPQPARPSGALAPLPDYVWKPDAKYAEMAYPSREYRLLALLRLWNVIDRFYPYKDLIDPWDPVLPEFIPRFEAAANEREYVLAVAELAARVADGHTRVFGSQSLNNFFGSAALPIEARIVEGQLVITELAGGASEDVAVGDVVVAIDGEPVAQRMQGFAKYTAGSTRDWLEQRLAQLALRGGRESIAELTLRGESGETRTVRIARRAPVPAQPAASAYKTIAGDLGYVDLRALTTDQVEAMFEALKDTKGLIFDMRGYPQGTAWPIAPRINTRGARYGASFYRELVGAGDRERLFFRQALPESSKWKYAGKTVMLIDDRAISQAEHTGLFFEAAADTKFIGSPTAGANGDVTRMLLPGGLSVLFTGHDVRHADGRQLQRIGLQPHVEVRPTIAGIRAGKDELLERAVRFLHDGS